MGRVYVVQSATGSSPVGRYCESDHGRSPGNGTRTSGCASYCTCVLVNRVCVIDGECTTANVLLCCRIRNLNKEDRVLLKVEMLLETDKGAGRQNKGQ